MDAIRIMHGGSSAQRQTAGEYVQNDSICTALASRPARSPVSGRSLAGFIAAMLLLPVAHAGYYAAPMESGDLTETLKTPWVFYDFGYGFDGCFESEQAIRDAWTDWRTGGGVCNAIYAGKNPDWPVEPLTGLTVAVPEACVPDDEYNIPIQNSIPLVRQHAIFEFDVQTYCGSSDWGTEGWVLHRESYEYCPAGYGFNLLSGNPWVHFCKRARPVYDQCLLEGNNLLSIGTGSKKHSHVDYIDTRNGYLHLTRHYNSNYSKIVGKRQEPGQNPEPAVGMFGANWRSSYEKSIYFPGGVSSTLAGLYRDDATFHFFNKQPDGTWVSNSDVKGILTKTAAGWSYRTADDTVEIYDMAGKLQSERHVDGTENSLLYDSEGRLYSVQGSTGESLTFYEDPADTDDFVDSVTDHAGRVWQYAYDESSNLEYVVYPDGTTGTDADNPVRQYHYENATYPNALTGITDERGVRYATFGYDGNGWAVSGYQGGSTSPTDSIDVDYHNDDHQGDGLATRTVSDGKGNQSTYTTIHQNGVALLASVAGPGCASCGNGDASYSYDAVANNLISRTESGVTTEYGNYDLSGNPGFRIEARGTAEKRRTDYSYDPRFYSKITRILEPSVFAADPATQCTAGVDCRKTEYSYDDWGNRLTEIISGYTPDGVPVSRSTTYQYNGPLHQLSQVDGPRSDVNDITMFEYYPDSPAEGANRARLKRITAADGTLLRDNIGYTPTGKVSTEYRPNNIRVDYDYFPGNDRLQASTVQDLSTGNSSRTAWTYLPSGEVESITIASHSPDAVTLTFGYDDSRRLTRIVDASGNYIEYTLDPAGNRTGESLHDNSGALRKALTRTFDAYNRLDVSMSGADRFNPLEQIDWDFAPDGSLDRRIDGRGVVTDYSYDNLKRLLISTQNPGGQAVVTRYAYDTADNLTSVTDPISGVTSYVYDDLGNLLSTSSPDTGTTIYTYDAAGNVSTRQDARGQVFAYSYDALNRLLVLDAPGTADDITYSYDNCIQGVGRLCSITSGGTTITTSYDSFGNATGHQQLSYDYDAASRIRAVTYPSGAVVTYGYNVAGQVNRVDLTAGGSTATLASSISYAPFGALTDLVYGNGAALTRELDTAYRLTSQIVPGALDLGYTQYDGNGNIRMLSDLYSGGSDFTYDALNRLATGSGPFGVRDYDYDLNGNRVQLVNDGQTTTYGYTPRSNRLGTEGGWTYTLDANGNATHKLAGDGLGYIYTYNSHNRLASVSDRLLVTTGKGRKQKVSVVDQPVASYSYNGLGQRISKSVTGGMETRYLYDNSGMLMAELDGEGVVRREYVYLANQLLAVLDPVAAPDNQGATVIVDNGNPPAGWTSKKSNKDYSADYLFSEGNSGNVVRWMPKLTAGSYDVYAWYVHGRKNSSQVPYTISHEGQLDTVFVDQGRNGGSWQLIAQNITFDGSEGEYIEVSDVNGRTTADAVRLVNVGGGAGAAGIAVSYIHNDHLGTPQAMTDAAGNLVWRAAYDPFGSASIDAKSTQVLNVRFPGQYYDEETGLHYNYFRYYDPSLSRYLTADPRGALLDFSAPERQVAAQLGIAFPAGKPFDYINHSYNYVDNNPLTGTDPTGEIDPVTAGLILWGLLYVNNAGDAISGQNGNLLPGYQVQDDVCSLPWPVGPIADTCILDKCLKHDVCYEDNKCNYSSWGASLLGGTKSCNKCNSNFFD